MQRGAALCLRLWLCLGLLDNERGEPSACPSAQLATSGDAFPGQMVGLQGCETGRGTGPAGPLGTRGDRVESQEFRSRKEQSRAGLAGMRKGRGRAAGQPSSVEMGSRLHSTVYGSAPLNPGPFALHPQPESFACLHACLRSRGTALLYPAICGH